MTVRPIVIAGDPVLHNPTELVDLSAGVTPELRTLIADMVDTLAASGGVGLSANQIGVGKRLFVIDCPDTDLPEGAPMPPEMIATRAGKPGWSSDGVNQVACVINPVLTVDNPPNGRQILMREGEGCLSVPGVQFALDRYDWAQVTGFNEQGKPITLSGYGFFAKCLQHEVGHLDGHLYTEFVPVFADLSLNPVTREVYRGDRPISLTRTEFALLELLISNPRRVLSRNRILEELWGYSFPTSGNALGVYIGYLRRKTESAGEERLIHTVRGVGYVMRDHKG